MTPLARLGQELLVRGPHAQESGRFAQFFRLAEPDLVIRVQAQRGEPKGAVGLGDGRMVKGTAPEHHREQAIHVLRRPSVNDVDVEGDYGTPASTAAMPPRTMSSTPWSSSSSRIRSGGSSIVCDHGVARSLDARSRRDRPTESLERRLRKGVFNQRAIHIYDCRDDVWSVDGEAS